MLDKFSMRSCCRAARLSAVALASIVAASVMLTDAPLHAANYTWAVSAGDWSVASNWWGAVAPTGSSSTAYIVNGGTANVTTIGAICGTLSLGNSAGSGSVQMTGGSLSTGYQLVGDSGIGNFA